MSILIYIDAENGKVKKSAHEVANLMHVVLLPHKMYL